MQPRTPRHALVLGGSGTVGSAIVRALRQKQVPCTFSYFRGKDRAIALQETGAHSLQLDLTQPEALRSAIAELEEQGKTIDVLIYAAGIAHNVSLAEISQKQWDDSVALHLTAPFLACQTLLPRMASRGGGDVLLLSGLDRAQSLPLPVAFAATQGAMGSMVMALAKDRAFSHSNLRINAVIAGLLKEGLSQQLDARLQEDFKNFSALRRSGSPDEIARVVCWFALENTFMTGRSITVNGGI